MLFADLNYEGDPKSKVSIILGLQGNFSRECWPHRCVCWFLNAKGVKPIEIHCQLTELYEESCMDVKNVRKWCREFTGGRTEIHAEERSGRPSISDETVAKVEQIMRQDRRITFYDLCILVPEVSRSTIGRTLTKKLAYRKVCARWFHACSQKATNGKALTTHANFFSATQTKVTTFWIRLS